MAARTSRWLPVLLTGFRPSPLSGRIFQPKLCRQNSASLAASGLPSASSSPAYTSSVFSRKITMFTRSGCFTGLGTPSNQRTGRRQTYRSSFCRRVTFRLRMPPPTGVVSGPLMATRCSAIVLTVLSGSHSPVLRWAFSPASTSFQAMRRLPP